MSDRAADTPLRLRIAIDPLLREQHGPEIHWTWRTLLAGIGFAWEEVAPGAVPCHIAYLTDPGQAGPATLLVRADPQRWRQRATYRLAGIGHGEGWTHPLYASEPQGTPPLEARDGRLIYNRDVIFDVFWLATGQEEAFHPKDRHGFGNGGRHWRDMRMEFIRAQL